MRFSQNRYTQMLGAVYQPGANNNIKGQALENLTAYLFQIIPGVEVIDTDARQYHNEEIDVILYNNQIHPLLRTWEDIILVECKNWATPVGAPETNWFLTKLRERKIHNGVLVAINGVTGDYETAAGRLIFDALRDGIRVIVLTREELAAINGRVYLCDLLKRKYCRLFLGKIS